MLASRSSNPAHGSTSANNPPSPTSSYNSKSDEDFNPDSAYDAFSASSSEVEPTPSVSAGTENASKLTELPTPIVPATAITKPVLKRKRGRPPRRREEDQNTKADAAVVAHSPAETREPRSEKKKTKKGGQKDEEGNENIGMLDSGDEATIQERAQKIKKRKALGRNEKAERVVGDGSSDDDSIDDYDDEEGGSGGWVKTRSQWRAEIIDRKPIQTTQGSSIDVDAIWANIASAPIRRTDLTNRISDASVDHNFTERLLKESPTNNHLDTNKAGEAQYKDRTGVGEKNIVNSSKQDDKDKDTITIKRTYKFAGETTTETRVVAKDSAEAKLHLSSTTKHNSQAQKSAASGTNDESRTIENDDTSTSDTAHAQRQSRSTLSLPPPPLRRPSRFDPNPTGHVPGLPEEVMQLTWYDRYRQSNNNTNKNDVNIDPTPTSTAKTAKAVATAAANQPVKLTTITKSALDWAQHVDAVEGLRDELDKYGKGKEDYLGKVDFLRGVEGRRFVDGRG